MEKTADSFETSPQQEALWLTEPDGPSARVQLVLEPGAPVPADSLRLALQTAVARHEILRTTFARRPGIRVPLQTVHEHLEADFTEHDISSEADLAALALAQLRAPLMLEDGPLLRVAVAHLGGERQSLVLTASALCADVSSLATLAGELLASLAGRSPAVEEPLQYADFAAWQRELANSEEDEARAAREFWAHARGLRSPLPPLVGAGAGGPTAQVAVALDPALVPRLTAQAARLGAPVAALVHAAWQVLLARLSGAEAVTVAYRAAERRHGDLEGAIGALARPVPVSVRVAGETTFAEVLGEVQRGREQALVRQDYAPAQGLPELSAGFTAYELPELPGARLADVAMHEPGLALNLLCGATGPAGGRLALAIAFDAGAQPRESAQRLAEELATLLAAVADGAAGPVAALPLLGPRERALVTGDWAAAPAPASPPLLPARFAAHAARAPHAPAVNDGRRTLSYGELETRSNQLAHRLRRAGATPGTAVGLCTERSVELVIGLLGILKAGAAYVPLHPEHPPARLAHQLSTAGARLLVTAGGLAERFGHFDGELVCPDREEQALMGEPAHAPEDQAGPDDLAYVIYTSGSTGTPKGVAVTHANLAAYADFITARLDAEAAPLAFAMVTAPSTDLGNTSLAGALASGGSLVLVDQATAADAGALARRFGHTPIDVLKITPSHIGALTAGGERGVLPRRTLVLGGERLTWDVVGRLRELAPALELINHYGPTEATIGCATYAIPDPAPADPPTTVPIGRPIGGARLYVLDEARGPVPVGISGRLHVGGAGVARGYIGAPEQTAERFLADPFAAGGRMYDTGDLARWLPDGTLEFLGRVDEQVKIRGYRVEPAEVGVALRSHAAVREAVVVARAAAGDTQLVAYCVLDGSAADGELRAHLADWVPEYMLPSAIVRLDALPQTPSGKIDRLALPDPDTVAAPAAEEEYVAPRTPMEEAVAQIWARVLGSDRVGVHDDFFALGGHSLLATQVVAQVRSDFAVELPLHSLFTYPTVETLTAELVRMMGDSEGDETAALLAELEGLSDEDAERLLRGESSPS